jgi:phage terminase large subunit
MSVVVETLSRWAKSSLAFVRENFGVEPDAWQKDVLAAWDDPGKNRIAMQACAGPGKTAVEAWCAWHFLSTHGVEGRHPNAYAISITGDNLRDNFWKEMAVWRAKSPFLAHQFEHTGSSIFHRAHPQTWWLRARAFRQTADADAKGARCPVCMRRGSRTSSTSRATCRRSCCARRRRASRIASGARS